MRNVAKTNIKPLFSLGFTGYSTGDFREKGVINKKLHNFLHGCANPNVTDLQINPLKDTNTTSIRTTFYVSLKGPVFLDDPVTPDGLEMGT